MSQQCCHGSAQYQEVDCLTTSSASLSFLARCCSLFDADTNVADGVDIFDARLPRDTDILRFDADDFVTSLPDRTLILLPVLEGATDATMTSSDRFVPGRVDSDTARPLTGKSSILEQNHSELLKLEFWDSSHSETKYFPNYSIHELGLLNGN